MLMVPSPKNPTVFLIVKFWSVGTIHRAIINIEIHFQEYTTNSRTIG